MFSYKVFALNIEVKILSLFYNGDEESTRGIVIRANTSDYDGVGDATEASAVGNQEEGRSRAAV